MSEQQTNPPMTKKDIMKIKDRDERLKAIAENMHLFSKELGKE